VKQPRSSEAVAIEACSFRATIAPGFGFPYPILFPQVENMRLPPIVVLTLALASAALAQTYTMKTFAGGALPENVPGASASLGNVYGIAIDNLNNVFLSLGDYHIVVRVDANTGVVTRVAGTGTAGYNGDNIPAASAQLLSLTGLGRTAQTFAEGAAPKTASNAVETVQIQVQGQPAQVTYTGVQPQYPGFDQVNVKLPNYTLTAGQSAVTFQITAPTTGQTLTYTLAAR
jgi:uncharacterized protein (TIGR03437 family)